MTNSSGFSIALLTISESSKLHNPAKHLRSFAISSLFSKNLLTVFTQGFREEISTRETKYD